MELIYRKKCTPISLCVHEIKILKKKFLYVVAGVVLCANNNRRPHGVYRRSPGEGLGKKLPEAIANIASCSGGSSLGQVGGAGPQIVARAPKFYS